jgi:hypothetical protein
MNQRDRLPHPIPAARAVPELDVTSYLPRPAAAVRPAEPPKPAISAASAALSAALDRLEKTVAQESEALANREPVAFADISRQKSQSLHEITRLSRALPPGQGSELKARLGPIRDRLAANHRLLGFHLQAVREVSDLMVGILHDAESDGTYGQTAPRRDARA